MIEFTLSKINLLILVTALFAIISFFAFTAGSIFLQMEVQREMQKYTTSITTMLAAPTLCDSKPFTIPSRFTSFGKDIYYTLHIGHVNDPQTSGKRVIFAVSDIRKPDTLDADDV